MSCFTLASKPSCHTLSEASSMPKNNAIQYCLFSIESTPNIVHTCEQQPSEDQLLIFIKGTSTLSKIRRWLLRIRIISWKHAFTLWCLKSTTAVQYEISRHLTTYPYMIHPFSVFRIYWEFMMVIFSIIALFATPVFLAFYFNESEKWHIFGNMIDSVFLCDIILWFLTGYYDYPTKTVVLDPRIVSWKYLKGFFLVDILPALPLEFIDIMSAGPSWYYTSINVLKIFRMRAIIVYAQRLRWVFKINFQNYKIAEMIIVLAMCIHWTACLEYYIPLALSNLFGENEESWIYSAYFEKRQTKVKKYLICLNRAITSLTCSAHYLDVKTPEDIILNLIFTVLGTLGFIYILAQLLQIMATFNSSSKKHYRRIQQLQEYVRYKELPHSLLRRLLVYCNYSGKKAFERDKQIISQVSPYLREVVELGEMRRIYLLKELLVYNYFKMVTTVELFQSMPRPMVLRLIRSIRSKIYLADDIIIKAGTSGDTLYYIASGTVAVYTSLGREVCHLEDGAYFGEMALVIEDEQRTASVLAVETCELYTLNKAHFTEAVKHYPDLLPQLQSLALRWLGKSHLLEDIYQLEGPVFDHINISNIRQSRRKYSLD